MSMPQAHWACMADRRSSLIMVRRPPTIWSVQRGICIRCDRAGYPYIRRGTLVKDGKTTGDRDPQTGAYPGKGDDFSMQGPGLWTDWSDGIYRKTYDRRIRLRGYQGRSDRWAGQSDLQGNGLYQYLRSGTDLAGLRLDLRKRDEKPRRIVR